MAAPRTPSEKKTPHAAVGRGEDALASQDALQAYLKDISALPLLDKGDEQRWAKQYSDARARMEQIIDCFPQVYIGMLKSLSEAGDSVTLSDYIDVKNGEVELLVDAAPRQELLGRIIRRILEDEKSLLAAIGRGEHRGTSATAPSGYNTGFSALLYQKLREFGRVRFLPRFYNGCFDFFVSGDWKPARQRDRELQRVLQEEMRQEQSRAREAMTALVEGNLRLVIYVVNSCNTSRFHQADLIQEGNIGLMRAVELFEYQRGHRFSTYACYWIRQAVIRAMAAGCRTIKLPHHVMHQLTRIRHAEQELLQLNGELPSPELLASHLQLPLPRIRALQRMAMQPISLQSLGNDERDWSEILADHHLDDGIPRDASNNLNSYLSSAMENLPPREQEILSRRFGLNGRPTETLEQIADSYGLSSERIRQLEATALQKLRRWSHFDRQ